MKKRLDKRAVKSALGKCKKTMNEMEGHRGEMLKATIMAKDAKGLKENAEKLAENAPSIAKMTEAAKEMKAAEGGSKKDKIMSARMEKYKCGGMKKYEEGGSKKTKIKDGYKKPKPTKYDYLSGAAAPEEPGFLDSLKELIKRKAKKKDK